MGNWKSGDPVKGAPTLITRSQTMEFVSLHHHSTFSYLDGYGTPESHMNRAAELGMTSLALTEHGNVTSHVQLEQAGKAAAVKPIFGCELYCGGVDQDTRTRRKNHLTVLSKDVSGYQNLLRLVSRGWDEGFYSEPTVSGNMLNEHKDGLIVLSGCTGSLLATSLIGGKNIAPEDANYKRAKKVAEKFKSSLGDAYYLEVQAFPELDKTKNINKGLAQMSEELKIPLVATLDAHYTKPDESEMQAILHNTRPGKKITIEQQMQNWGYDVKLCPPASDADLLDKLIHTGLTRKQAQQAIANTALIAAQCNVDLPKVDNLKYPLPPHTADAQILFRTWLNEGWDYRQLGNLSRDDRKRYIERVKYEAQLIQDKGFTDYFLVVSDAVKFAKDNGIPVGPARGSAAASLVCYLLRITEVNPMPFANLLFERFIDANRHDLPDIDLDFDDELRWQVRDYLVSKYGADRVGNIGTFVRYKGKNSLDDVARVFRVPEDEVKKVKELLIERSSGDLRANATIEDTVEMFPQVKEVMDQYPELYKSQRLEGNVKTMSVHAAGLVIANSPLSDFCAIYTRSNSKGETQQVVSLDKHDAEYLNVLKLDALGLKTMAMIRIALEEIGMSLEELYAIELTDPETLKGFQAGDVVGVFQFDGRAMRSVNNGVLPDNFNEVCDINALARPGPLHSGATAEYIDVKHGRSQAHHYHEIVDNITKHTQFQVVYQEQILQVVRNLGEFSWEEAARIRKIISKKRGEQEFNAQRDKFVAGASKHGMGSVDANRVFSMLATAGAYAFNAAHCVSYGMLAYWTMWIKRNHPQAFYVACLRKYEDKRSELLRDAAKHNIKFRSLHLNRSEESWTTDGDSIRPGFTQVSGIGQKTAFELLATREKLEKFNDWKDVASVRGVGPKTVQLMKDFIDAPDPFGLQLLTTTLGKARERLRSGVEDDSGTTYLPEPTYTSEEVPYERGEKDTEVVWIGVIRERNLKDLFELHHSRTGEHLDPKDVWRPDLNEWVVMLGEDDTDILTITVPRTRYTKFKEDVWNIVPNKDLVLIRGLKKGNQARRAVYITDMWTLPVKEETNDVAV